MITSRASSTVVFIVYVCLGANGVKINAVKISAAAGSSASFAVIDNCDENSKLMNIEMSRSAVHKIIIEFESQIAKSITAVNGRLHL